MKVLAQSQDGQWWARVLMLTITCFLSPALMAAGVLDELSLGDCKFSDSVNHAVSQTEKLLEQKKYSEALTALSAVRESQHERNCEKYALEALHVVALYNTGDLLETLDAIDATMASGIIPEADQSLWLSQKAAVKLLAKDKKVAKDRATKKRLKLTAEEEQAYRWELFRKGKFVFPVESGFGGKILGTLGKMSGSVGDVEMAESYFDNRQWESLARYVLHSRFSKGFDVDYFYLAAAAAGLRLDDAARIYANKAVVLSAQDGSSSCKRMEVSSGYKRMNYCAGHRVNSESKAIVKNLDLRVAEEKKQQAALAQRQKEAAERVERAAQLAAEEKRKAAASAAAVEARKSELSAHFPEEWVDDILNGRIQKGMSKAAVRESRGDPSRVEKIDSQEMWHYGSTRVVFTGDVATFVDG